LAAADRNADREAADSTEQVQVLNSCALKQHTYVNPARLAKPAYNPKSACQIHFRDLTSTP
jgi:hypothetical protein